jgi:hypothetical protein
MAIGAYSYKNYHKIFIGNKSNGAAAGAGAGAGGAGCEELGMTSSSVCADDDEAANEAMNTYGFRVDPISL